MNEDRNKIFIQMWLNYAAHYSTDEQIDILLVCSWVEKTGAYDDEQENLLTWAAEKTFQLPTTGRAYNFLKRMEELKASPAGIAGAIREMLVKGGEE